MQDRLLYNKYHEDLLLGWAVKKKRGGAHNHLDDLLPKKKWNKTKEFIW